MFKSSLRQSMLEFIQLHLLKLSPNQLKSDHTGLLGVAETKQTGPEPFTPPFLRCISISLNSTGLALSLNAVLSYDLS